MGRVWFYVKLDPDAVSLRRIRNPATALQICCPNVIQYCALLSSAGLGIRIRIFGVGSGWFGQIRIWKLLKLGSDLRKKIRDEDLVQNLTYPSVCIGQS